MLYSVGYSESFLDAVKPYSNPDNNIQEEYIIGDKEITSVTTMNGEEKFKQTITRGKDVPFTDLAGRSSKV